MPLDELIEHAVFSKASSAGPLHWNERVPLLNFQYPFPLRHILKAGFLESASDVGKKEEEKTEKKEKRDRKAEETEEPSRPRKKQKKTIFDMDLSSSEDEEG